MTTAHSYARALFEMLETSPQHSKVFFENLQKTLKRRGHQKLLPRIMSEYEKLDTAHQRRDLYATVTPQMERTRVLMQLYKKLTA
jgi:F0F1-type ATP synthase delta subunit